jgi:hypothetical protein
LVEEQALTKSSNCLKLSVVLLQLKTDSFQQFGDFCQSLFFYQIRTAFNNLKILSEFVLLPNTDSFEQFEDLSDEGGQCLVEVEQTIIKIFKLLKAVSI